MTRNAVDEKPSGSTGSHDFSMRSVPSSWVEAQGSEALDMPLIKQKTLAIAPDSEKPDVVTGTIAALAMSAVAGAAWYALETQDVLTSPWMAAALGFLIGMAVRLGMGGKHSDVRSTLSLIFYVMTLFAVAYMIERFDFISIYGSAPDLKATERELVRDRLTEPETMLAWLTGAILCIQVGYVTRTRRFRAR